MADLADLVAAAYARVNIFIALPLVRSLPIHVRLVSWDNMFSFSHEAAVGGVQGLPPPHPGRSERRTSWPTSTVPR